MTDPTATQGPQADQAPQAVPPQPAPAPRAASSTEDPGFTLGLVGLISGFFMNIVGLILGYVGWQQSKAAGLQNPLALVAMIYSGAMLAMGVVITAFVVITTGAIGLIFAIIAASTMR